MGFLRLLGLGKSARLAREATAQLAREAATTIDKGEKERLSVGDLAAHNHNGQRVGQIALTRALEEHGCNGHVSRAQHDELMQLNRADGVCVR